MPATNPAPQGDVASADEARVAYDAAPEHTDESGWWPPTERLAQSLPEPISSGLELEGWVWLAWLKNDEPKQSSIWDAEVSLQATKSFSQRVAISAQVNFIDADDYQRVEWEQVYASAKVFEEGDTFVTVGKFNADFGVEGRDFWERTSGTPSLLFAAQPQDLMGAMITQPVGETGLKLKPFISTDFQGQLEQDQSPSAGLSMAYSTSRELEAKFTTWFGPGYILKKGKRVHHPFDPKAYGGTPAGAAENWMGPNLYARKWGTLKFFEPAVIWRPREDLSVSAEMVYAVTDTRERSFGWNGWMVQVDYDLSDTWHADVRFSYLDDSDWIITDEYQVRSEISAGLGWHFAEDFEVRGELRHDSSDDTPDCNIASIHLTFRF